MNNMATTSCDQMLTKIDEGGSFYVGHLNWALVVSPARLVDVKRATVDVYQHNIALGNPLAIAGVVEVFATTIRASLYLGLSTTVIKRQYYKRTHELCDLVGDIQHDDRSDGE